MLGGKKGVNIFRVMRGSAGGCLASERKTMDGVTGQENSYSLDLRHILCLMRRWNGIF